MIWSELTGKQIVKDFSPRNCQIDQYSELVFSFLNKKISYVAIRKTLIFGSAVFWIFREDLISWIFYNLRDLIYAEINSHKNKYA